MNRNLFALTTVMVLASCVTKHAGDADVMEFVKTFYPKAQEVVTRCQEYDTDHNGYVTCTVKVDEQIVAVECPVNVNVGCDYRNTECRLAKGMAQRE